MYEEVTNIEEEASKVNSSAMLQGLVRKFHKSSAKPQSTAISSQSAIEKITRMSDDTESPTKIQENIGNHSSLLSL